jgi:hypothetical protein
MKKFLKWKKSITEIFEKSSKTNKYEIDINPNSQSLSKDFKDFFHNHFVDSYGLTRNEVDTSFFKNMSAKEKEIAKNIIRKNLHLKYVHLFKASGELEDEKALPILYEFINNEKDLSWKLTIGRAIWKINKDKVYEDLLISLATSIDENLKYAHFEQLYDLGENKKIQFLQLMTGKDETLSERRATEILCQILNKKEFSK